MASPRLTQQPVDRNTTVNTIMLIAVITITTIVIILLKIVIIKLIFLEILSLKLISSTDAPSACLRSDLLGSSFGVPCAVF